MNDLMALLSASANAQAQQTLLRTNDAARQYGLSLTPEQAQALLKSWNRILKESGRIELGDSILEQLILGFCDSPYLSDADYADTIEQLLELFYNAKNDTLGLIPDDELIVWMRSHFDDACGGSLEHLSLALESLARNLRTWGREDAPAPEDTEVPRPEDEGEDSSEYKAKEEDGWRSLQL